MLFIGNSLTATQTNATGEDMPAVLARMASGRSKSFSFARAIDLGQTLQHSWDAAIPQPFLTAARWDYVVLQEYSTMPVQDAALFYSTAVTTYQAAIQRSLKAGSGSLLLFENWALVDLYPFATRAAYTAALDANYAKLSGLLTTPNRLVPLSRAFERVFATRPQSYLFNPDGKHPNDAAIYLNAAVFYGMLFGESPAGLPTLYLSSSDAAFLQDIAAQVLEPGAPPVDAGVASDAGPVVVVDAGPVVVVDAGPVVVVDAGSPGVDAGSMPADPSDDAGGTQRPAVALSSTSGGCASGGPASFWTAALAAAIARRRKRHDARARS